MEATGDMGVGVDGKKDGQDGRDRRRSKPAPFGMEGRGVGYAFNPIFREPIGGGGGAESGMGEWGVQRAVAPRYG